MQERKRKPWNPPPEFLAPTDPEEFKFAFCLMDAAYSGKMPIPNPTQRGVVIEKALIPLTDIPFNRAIIALYEHFAEKSQSQFTALAYRLTSFHGFLGRCLAKKDPRIEKYFHRENGAVVGIREVLIKAAATVEIGRRGFVRDSIFATAEKLLEGKN